MGSTVPGGAESHKARILSKLRLDPSGNEDSSCAHLGHSPIDHVRDKAEQHAARCRVEHHRDVQVGNHPRLTEGKRQKCSNRVQWDQPVGWLAPMQVFKQRD
jgi:hypothetical protein